MDSLWKGDNSDMKVYVDNRGNIDNAAGTLN